MLLLATEASEVPLVFMELKVIALLILPFHELIEIDSILLQVLLHIIQGSFVRVRRSEQDVNTYWKRRQR
jgi:hypothetical protein